MAEIWNEIITEITSDVGSYLIEVVQFLLLIGIAYVVAVGFGKRKGMVVNMLTERREHLIERVERAQNANKTLADAREAAAARVAAARAESDAIVAQAEATAGSAREQARAAADAEAAAIRARAQDVLVEERSKTQIEERDRLVGIVAQATRSLLNEGLSPAEQRQLVQGIVSAQVDRLSEAAGDSPEPAIAQ